MSMFKIQLQATEDADWLKNRIYLIFDTDADSDRASMHDVHVDICINVECVNDEKKMKTDAKTNKHDWMKQADQIDRRETMNANNAMKTDEKAMYDWMNFALVRCCNTDDWLNKCMMNVMQQDRWLIVEIDDWLHARINVMN